MKDQKLKSYLTETPGTESLRETITIIEILFGVKIYLVKDVKRYGIVKTTIVIDTEDACGGLERVWIGIDATKNRSNAIQSLTNCVGTILEATSETEDSIRMKYALRGEGEKTA